MAAHKTARRDKQRRTRQRKFRKGRKTVRDHQRGKIRKGRKTVRGHRHSTTGTLYPPLDVRTPHDVQEILKRITKGPVTVVLVYADWCGHCHTLMPHFKAASKLPQRNSQVISIPDYRVKEYNNVIKSHNRSAKGLNVLGYPSVVLVGPDGTQLSEIASTKEALESAMVNVAPVAVEAGLDKMEVEDAMNVEPNSIRPLSARRIPSPRRESPKEIINNMVENEIVPTSRNSVQNITMEEIGVEPMGLAMGPTTGPTTGTKKLPSFEHLNDDIINRGEIGIAPPLSTNRSTRRISGINVPESAIKKSSNTITAKEAEEITSLRVPVGSQSGKTTSSLVDPYGTTDISDTVPIRIKGIKGGSLYGIMSQSAYRLAPAGVLLATAAAVMRNPRAQGRRTRKR